MDWFKGQFTGNPHIQWENLWFPVVFPLNQSSDVNHFFHRSDHSMKKMIKINGLIRSLKSIFFSKKQELQALKNAYFRATGAQGCALEDLWE